MEGERRGALRAARRSRLTVRRTPGVATIELALPADRLDGETHAALARVCEDLDLDDDLRLVIVRSRGRAFCLGDDSSVGDDAPDGVAAVGRLRVPSLAVLSGDACDAGLELALACDLRIAATTARLGLTQVGRGALPVHGGTQRLPRIVGAARAARMLLLAEILTARQAREAGLVQAVAPPQRLSAEVRRWVAVVRQRAPIAQRLAKEALRAASDLPLAEGLRLEGDLYVLLQTTRDRREGIASFHEGRRPRFEGR